MPRRFQFSLRALLVGVVSLCIALGGRHIYVMYFASYVIADAKVGEPVVLSGQFFVFDGPDSMGIRIGIAEPVAKPGRFMTTERTFLEAGCTATRSGLGTYCFSKKMPPRWTGQPAHWSAGKFDVYVQHLGKRTVIGQVIVDP